MTAGPLPLDHAVVLVFVVLSPIVDLVWFYPWLLRGARSRAYALGILGQWMGAACVLALWFHSARPWTALRLGAVSPSGAGIGLVLAVAFVSLLIYQRRALLARPDRLVAAFRDIGGAGPLVPRTPGESRGFLLLSISAGICEELLFRGYLMWYLATWTGLAWAAVISSVVFGAGHLYLDGRSALKAGIVGAVMAGITIAAGSLLPAMLIHAAVDMNSGSLGFRAAALGGLNAPGAPTPPAAPRTTPADGPA